MIGNKFHRYLDIAHGALKGLQPKLGKQHVEKAGEWTTSDIASAGKREAEQQDRFIQTMINESKMLRHVRALPMNSSERLVDRIAFTSRVMHAATEVTALAAGKRSKPATAKVTLSAKEYIGECRLGYSTLEDVIEGVMMSGGGVAESQQAILQTIEAALAKALARDLEEFAIQGDTTSGDADLAVQDGWLKLASNEYDHLGAAIAKGLFKGTLLALPKQFRQDKTALRFFYGSSTETEWRDELGDRGSALGDVAVSDRGNRDIDGGNGAGIVFGAYGVPAHVVTLMPEDLGSSSDLGKMLITNPLNAVVGIRRDIHLDWDKDVTTRELILVPTFRVAFNFEDADGAARGVNFKVA